MSGRSDLGKPLSIARAEAYIADDSTNGVARVATLRFSRRKGADMFGILKARKARRTATVAIVPFVQQSQQRLGQIPESAWSSAYVIGFLSTLITLVAMREAGSLGTDLLASVQADAWSDITGQDNILLGEQMCELSTAGDPSFDQGCHNATRFFEALDAVEADLSAGHLDATGEIFEASVDESRTSLWTSYFDSYVGRLAAPEM